MAKSRAKVVLWHLAMAGAGLGASAAWHWQRRWGATVAEQRAVLPGDSLVPQPGLQATRAVGIDAPPSAVWPWLAQIGKDKAGFYCGGPSRRVPPSGEDQASVIVPEWQGVAPGDSVRLTESVELTVDLVEPRRALVLGNPARDGHADVDPAFDFSWAFVLEPEGPAGTRLVARERYAWTKWPVGLALKAFAWVSFTLGRAMLVGVKRLAEQAWLSELSGTAIGDPIGSSAAPSAAAPAGAGPAAAGGGTDTGTAAGAGPDGEAA
ncbi:MAG: hypothetical protein LBJ02_07830 [Bifidobacteriaceae bacterium]|jgi:hypothetical protein|nr:hypothetical protein [Bifidobacteriaceae bacterium]